MIGSIFASLPMLIYSSCAHSLTFLLGSPGLHSHLSGVEFLYICPAFRSVCQPPYDVIAGLTIVL